MANKETLQTNPPPSEWAEIPPIWWKWFNDLCELVQGKNNRQLFLNTLTDTKTNNVGVKSFFINDSNGDAHFTKMDGQVDPYIGPGGEFIVPGAIIAGSVTTSTSNTPAVRAYQTFSQNIANATPMIVTYGATDFDTDSSMVTATGKYTPKTVGKYLVTGSLGFEGTNVYPDKYVSLGIAKNGATVGATKIQSTYSGDIIAQVSDLVSMNGTTDYLQLAVEHNMGFSTPTWGNSYTCYFTAHKVA